MDRRRTWPAIAAIERTPIVFDYRGHRVVTMPPPSAGGVTLRQIFAASEALELYEMPWESVDRIHLYVEALRRVYADRNQLIADPAFVNIPMAKLLDADYMAERMANVDRERATPSSEVGAGVEIEGEAADHALLGGRRQGHGGRHHLHAQRRLRRQPGRARAPA